MKPPSFPFYVNNWLASERVSAMKPEQEGAYIRLLAFAWNSADCGLPNDPDVLASLSRLNGRWSDLSATILKCFHEKDGRLYNEKLLDCWRKAQEFSERQRMKGKASGQARRQPETNHGSTVVQPVLNSESEFESESDSETDIEKTTKSVTLSDFDTFWTAYPRKTGKKAALKAWGNAKDKPALSVILAAIEAQKGTEEWRRDNGQYIPHPATWLNQGRWADQPIETQRRSTL